MNHRKRKQSENLKKKRMHTPDLNSLSRAWARSACAHKYKKKS